MRGEAGSFSDILPSSPRPAVFDATNRGSKEKGPVPVLPRGVEQIEEAQGIIGAEIDVAVAEVAG